MSCINYIERSCSIYDDICDLLNKLGIPSQEQTVLWNAANKNMCCKRFREILSALIKMKEVA